MIALIQRVTSARVRVSQETVGSIGPGLLAFLAVQRGDGTAQAQRLAEKLLRYRVFPDSQGRMNLDVTQADGELLLVPQFTLAADTRRGNRPGFDRAAAPELARALFDLLVDEVAARWPRTATGAFGADMDVELINHGPVTFWLEVPPEN